MSAGGASAGSSTLIMQHMPLHPETKTIGLTVQVVRVLAPDLLARLQEELQVVEAACLCQQLFEETLRLGRRHRSASVLLQRQAG